MLLIHEDSFIVFSCQRLSQARCISCQVKIACTPGELLDLLEQYTPDVMILDLIGQSDGSRTLLDTLRLVQQHYAIPAIVPRFRCLLKVRLSVPP